MHFVPSLPVLPKGLLFDLLFWVPTCGMWIIPRMTRRATHKSDGTMKGDSDVILPGTARQMALWQYATIRHGSASTKVSIAHRP